MNPFQLKFTEFLTLSNRIDATEGSNTVPIFPLFYYFDGNLYLYKLYGGYVFCTIISKEDVGDFEAFKQRYLPKAYSLMTNNIDSYSSIPSNIIEELQI